MFNYCINGAFRTITKNFLFVFAFVFLTSFLHAGCFHFTACVCVSLSFLISFYTCDAIWWFKSILRIRTGIQSSWNKIIVKFLWYFFCSYFFQNSQRFIFNFFFCSLYDFDVFIFLLWKRLQIETKYWSKILLFLPFAWIMYKKKRVFIFLNKNVKVISSHDCSICNF